MSAFFHVCMPTRLTGWGKMFGRRSRTHQVIKCMFNETKLTPMKKTVILMAAFAIAVVALGQEYSASLKSKEITESAAFVWTATVYDFGKIQKDSPVSHEFTFTNSGEEALIISSVQASCGCTVTEYTKDPIPAGKTGFVKATYNAAKVGVFTKSITIKANTQDEATLLTIKGEVVE